MFFLRAAPRADSEEPMPVTPFHIGPGILAKAVLPRRFSFSSFLLTQVAIDAEVVCYMVRGKWPLHRFYHTLPGCTFAGLVSGALILMAGALIARRFARDSAELRKPAVRSEWSWAGALTGALFGAWSHALLDAILYDDVRIFWPFSDATPFYGMIAMGTLHAGCLVAGALGVVVLLMRRSSL